MTKKRIATRMDSEAREVLRWYAVALGVSVPELVRRIVAKYIETGEVLDSREKIRLKGSAMVRIIEDDEILKEYMEAMNRGDEERALELFKILSDRGALIGKSHKGVEIGAMVPENFYEAVKREAEKRGLTVYAFLREILTAFLAVASRIRTEAIREYQETVGAKKEG